MYAVYGRGFSGSVHFREVPFARQWASAIQEINPVVSYCCYLPWLMLQRASDIFPWQKFSLDGAGTAIIHHRTMTSSCCLWIYRGTVQALTVLNLLGSFSLFLRPTTTLLAFPRTPENPVHGAQGRTKETTSTETGKSPAPLEGLAFSICQ